MVSEVERLDGVARSWRGHPTKRLYREAQAAARAVLRRCGQPADEKAVQSVLNGLGVRLEVRPRIHA